MFAKLWDARGVDYPTLVDRLIALALERHAEKQATEHERVLIRATGASFLTSRRRFCA